MNYRLITLISIATLLGGCRRDAPTDTKLLAAPTCHTVNYPLAYFAERIAAGMIDVNFPAPADTDPAYWNPGAETIAAYQNSDLILLNGAGYAKWTTMASLPPARLVRCDAGLEPEFIEEAGGLPHTHGPTGEHSHNEIAFTLWLDPQRAIRMAQNIKQAFAKQWPDHTSVFDRGFESLKADLNRLDSDMEKAWKTLPTGMLIFSHPVYQYMEDRYQFSGHSLHWEPGEDPGAGQWEELDRHLAKHPAKVMVWEAMPLESTINQLSQRGITVVVIDPCANLPAKGDFLDVMNANLKALDAH